jgi:hypothetical protein
VDRYSKESFGDGIKTQYEYSRNSGAYIMVPKTTTKDETAR